MAAHDADGKLRWAGNVGSGFDTRTLVRLKEKLAPLKVKTSPLETGPQPPGRVHWVRPELVAQISHAGFTHARRLRQLAEHDSGPTVSIGDEPHDPSTV